MSISSGSLYSGANGQNAELFTNKTPDVFALRGRLNNMNYNWIVVNFKMSAAVG